MGRRRTPGRMDAHSQGALAAVLTPSLGVRDGVSWRCSRPWLGAVGGHLLPPPVRAGDGMRGGTAGTQHGSLPALSQGGRMCRWETTSSLQVENYHLLEALTQWCLRGQRGCQLWWMITLGADLSCCIFSRLHHAMFAFPFAVCSFWVLATWTPQPRMTNTSFLKAPGQQQFQEEASWPLHFVRCGRAGVGDRSPPVFPLAQLVAVPSPDGLPSRPWAARLGLERLRRVCHTRCARAVCWQTGSGWDSCPAARQPTVTC